MANDLTLLGKVMLAINNAERAGINLPPLDSVDQMLLNDADYIRPQAQAAIDTIRAEIAEPSEAMKEAALSHRFNGDYTKVWRLMFSASPLGEKKD